MHSSETSLTKLRVNSEVRLQEEVRTEQRKKAVMMLVLHHLVTHGYVETAERLQSEANVSLKKWTVADNVDLISIVQEFENFHQLKFGRVPKIIRALSVGEAPIQTPKSLNPRNPTYDDLARQNPRDDTSIPDSVAKLTRISPSKVVPPIQQRRSSDSQRTNPPPTAEAPNQKYHPSSSIDGIVVSSTTIRSHPTATNHKDNKPASHDETPVDPVGDLYAERLLKPLPGYGNSEFKELASIITRDIFVENPNVKWDDIAGLDVPKRLVREAVVYPIKFPELFTGILSPWQGILLYGPPGTGKTMLAKAIATECRTTFFNISASSIVSKWRGDSEKLVRVLFELARYHAPSTIFLDELESIMSQRSSDNSEHEGSRRMKTELLIQMDGLAKLTSGSQHIFLLAASNLPWELDIAMLRRLEKRILIDLPDEKARRHMFQHHLGPNLRDPSGRLLVDELDYAKSASLTPGYSGSDIKLVCKEAAMRPLRAVFELLEADGGVDSNLPAADLRRRISMEDVLAALSCTKPAASNTSLEQKYRQWQQEYASE
ncbi:hypothetical protein SeMB42_g01002 [Synchytrium endobioticum]|uniref:Katanin p60 ATPase-containing subunit A-like 2 n=1 Tax=Synchytrium endobioticum TaxID=286115 RepID=A0A507CI73_9FUNG|nr:hypothetical protein SeLEV6574_g07286 [Synchytrium endobioticum]TPX53109.1 hypothetical protein SeMB42_g01002 [Synchytrium endobioticum]